MVNPGAPPPLLDVEGVAKSYGEARVLSGIDLRLERGQSIALIGENGAGKSTLSKILTGVIKPTTGAIGLDAVKVEFGSPRDAIAAGIAFIPQELACVPQMTIADNVLLDWPKSCTPNVAVTQPSCRPRTNAAVAAAPTFHFRVERVG